MSRAITFSLAGLAAVLTALLAPHWVRGTVRIVAEYDMAALVLLLGFFVLVFRDDENRTRARAAMNDPGRNLVLAITLISVGAGLLGAINILGKGPAVQTDAEKAAAVCLALAAAILGWAVTHATFALRYAHLFYRDDDGLPCDALTFPKTPEPDDYDFLYFAFIIGMTFQVSDVAVNDSGVRRLVLIHGLVSFAYNTAIIALGVNLVSNMLH
jgi:uncharacterized membrane protein